MRLDLFDDGNGMMENSAIKTKMMHCILFGFICGLLSDTQLLCMPQKELCVICYEYMSYKKSSRLTLNCQGRHTFHRSCVEGLIKGKLENCPLCRDPLEAYFRKEHISAMSPENVVNLVSALPGNLKFKPKDFVSLFSSDELKKIIIATSGININVTDAQAFQHEENRQEQEMRLLPHPMDHQMGNIMIFTLLSLIVVLLGALNFTCPKSVLISTMLLALCTLVATCKARFFL